MVAKAGNRECAMSITFPLLLPLLLPFLLLPFASSESSSYGADIAIEEVVRRLESKRAPAAVQEAAAQGVLRRLLPTHVSSFRFQIASQGLCKRFGCFRLSSINGSGGDGPEILIQGTTGVELSFGLHWYLKYWCGAHISWDKTGGNQLGTVPPPGSLPHVEGEGVKVERPVPWSYYQNVVTSSYSFAFWDWKRWEKEIDWMALHGINLPLAFTGQEAVWKKVLKRFNVSTEDLNGFFGGPAFLAWARMGNLHGWGGPLSENWLTQQLSMQKQILSRMVDLGITPVLPSFSGNVPAVFTKIFPTASITRLGDWNTVDGDTRWCCTYLLDPSDPLFVEVGAAFINQQTKEYGDITDIYSCDTFNENTPPTSDPTYIASLGAAVYKAMSKGDNDAIWLMQGWLFSSSASFWKPPQMKALIHSVPVGKMIVLDLFAEVRPIWQRSSHFYGVPYVWCMLHNFGGNIEMYGILDSISIGPVDARMSQNSTMVGVGMCMEGIEQNPVVYELMSEMAFRHQQVEVHKWLKSYSFRRYGHSIPQIQAAWDILYHTIYNCTDGIENHNRDYILEFLDQSPLPMNTQLTNGRLFQRFSRLKKSLRILIKRHGPETHVPHLWYPTEDVVNALKLFLQAGDDVGRSSPYRYDLADLARQVLSKLANQAYLDVMAAYQRKDPQELTLYSHKFLEFIQDIEELLASNENFLLGTWLESAKSLAITDGERKQYEWNARTQITMWYDNTMTNQSKLHDYGNKFWSGLLRSYYLPRASSYFSYLSRSLQENEDFRLEEWRKDWISYSNSWQSGNELYPTEAKGDTLLIAKSLFQKYYG